MGKKYTGLDGFLDVVTGGLWSAGNAVNQTVQSDKDANTARKEREDASASNRADKEAVAAEKAAKASEAEAEAAEKAAEAAEKSAEAAKKANESAAKLAKAQADSAAKAAKAQADSAAKISASETKEFEKKLEAAKPIAIGAAIVGAVTLVAGGIFYAIGKK
jgi:cobalamin biosynthesis Mg chelatase CobN